MTPRSLISVASILAAAVLAMGQTTTAPATRPAVASADLAKALKIIDEVYKAGLAAANTPALKLTQAAKMLEVARADVSPEFRLALFIRSREVALAAGDATLAFKALDEAAQSFDIPAAKLRIELIVALTRTVHAPAQGRVLLAAARSALDEALLADDIDAARSLAAVALAAARVSGDHALIKLAVDQTVQIPAIDAAFAEFTTAKATLEKAPNDPDANLKVGRYLCFFKGDWAKGLPRLAKGSDESAKTAAVLDLAGAATGQVKIEIGDKWWDAAASQRGIARRHIIARAGMWYAEALSETNLGPAKVQTEKRLAAIRSETSPNTPKPPLLTEKTVPGKWFVADIAGKQVILVFHADHTFTKETIPSFGGRWEIVDGEVRFATPDGWLMALRQRDDLVIKLAWKPGRAMSDPPTYLSGAAKQK